MISNTENTMLNFSKAEDEFFSNRFFLLNKKLFCAFGLWPFQSFRNRIIIMIAIWIGIFSLFVPMVFEKFINLSVFLLTKQKFSLFIAKDIFLFFSTDGSFFRSFAGLSKNG